MKQKLINGEEQDVVGGGRGYYTYLQRAGVASRIKRAMRRRRRREGKQQVPAEVCRAYWCPTAKSYECCGLHCGFDVCCDAPELHWTLTPLERQILRLVGQPIPGSE